MLVRFGAAKWSECALHGLFNGETGRDIIGQESVICNVLHSGHKKKT